jgi:hypothetical protein
MIENFDYDSDIFHCHSNIFHYCAENTGDHKSDKLWKSDTVV